MTTTILRGLTWGHRRAIGPLDPLTSTFRFHHPEIDVEWVVRPLSEFEHQGLATLANEYDLVIFDHPFGGSIVETGVFEPLSSHPETMLSLADTSRYLGGSMLSYRFGGSIFGLPIDAASQNAAYRADLLKEAGEAIPISWNEALALGTRIAPRGVKLGLAIKTPHAGLVVAALMANAGKQWSTAPDEPFVIDYLAFVEAYEAVRELFAYCHNESLKWNAIDLHEAMVTRDDIAYTPCIFGYGTYGEADYRRRLSFADFAGRVAPYYAGAVLGGTGLAVSRQSINKEAALEFVAFAASEEGQKLIQSQHGQPGLALLWAEGEANLRFNRFFTSARRSVETAWTRPRYRGYISFQAKFGELVAAGLSDKTHGTTLWPQVEFLMREVNR